MVAFDRTMYSHWWSMVYLADSYDTSIDCRFDKVVGDMTGWHKWGLRGKHDVKTLRQVYQENYAAACKRKRIYTASVYWMEKGLVKYDNYAKQPERVQEVSSSVLRETHQEVNPVCAECGGEAGGDFS